MRRPLRHATLALALLTAAISLAPRRAEAQAQLSEAEKKAAARALFTDGVKAQDAGHPADALVLFQKAQNLYDAPTHLMHIAQCQVLTGKLVEAAETYETLKRVQLAPSAPDVFVQAKTQAAAELPGVRARIPSLKIELSPKPEGLRNLQVVVNNVIIPVDLVGVARPVNPGVAKVSARADGYAQSTLDVTIKEKETRSVTLALAPGSGPPPPAAVPGAPGTPPPLYPPPDNAKPSTPPRPPPTSAGIIVGAHVGGIGIARETAGDGSGGLAGGADFMFRFAKVVLVGATAQVSSINSVTGYMGAARISFLTSPDRLAFTAGALGGVRGSGGVNGGTFGGTLGLSIPVNPHFRIDPRLDVTATRYDVLGLTPYVFLGVGGYFNHDFKSKPEDPK